MAIKLIGLQIQDPIVPQLRLEFDDTFRTNFNTNNAGILEIQNTGDRVEFQISTVAIIHKLQMLMHFSKVVTLVLVVSLLTQARML